MTVYIVAGIMLAVYLLIIVGCYYNDTDSLYDSDESNNQDINELKPTSEESANSSNDKSFKTWYEYTKEFDDYNENWYP